MMWLSNCGLWSLELGMLRICELGQHCLVRSYLLIFNSHSLSIHPSLPFFLSLSLPLTHSPSLPPSLSLLVRHPDKRVITPALRSIGNIVTGDDVQTQIIINCSVLPALQHLLGSNHDNLRKESCWTLSNITAGNKVQIQVS